MKLSDILGINIADKNIILVGQPELTNYTSSEGEPYYVVKTKKPVLVTCSVDKDIPSFEADEVYVRESAIASENWKFVDEKKPEEGYFMEGWKVDFSKSQELPLYQETTIEVWKRGERKSRGITRNTGIKERLAAKIAAKGAKQS